MALLGNGLLAVWNDIPPEFEARFNGWYRDEHLAERVGLPGFRRGRRYRRLGEGEAPAYGALYETDAPEAMASAAYLARLDDPSPPTREALAQFRNMHRSVCRVETSLGRGVGGVLAALRPADEAAAKGFEAALPGLVGEPGVMAAHLCAAVPELTRNDSAESRVRVAPDTVDAWLALVEGSDPEALIAALAAHHVETAAVLYRLIHLIHADDL